METHLTADKESRFYINAAQRTSRNNGGSMANPTVEIEIDILGPNGTGHYRYNGEDNRRNKYPKTPTRTSERYAKTSVVQDDEETEESSWSRETTPRIRGTKSKTDEDKNVDGDSGKLSKNISKKKGKKDEEEEEEGRTSCCLPCVDSYQDKKKERSRNNSRGTLSKFCCCILYFKDGCEKAGEGDDGGSAQYLGGLAVWLLFVVLAAGLSIAALVVDEWSSLKHSPTQHGRKFGLLKSFERFLPSCKTSDVVDATMESEYDKFNLNVSLFFVIVGIISDFVSVIVGCVYCRCRKMSKGKGKLPWTKVIPTMVSDLMSAELLLAACAMYNSDLEGVSHNAKAVEDTSCPTFVQNVSLSRELGDSFYLALASACISVVRAVIFGVVACIMHPKNEKKLEKDKGESKLKIAAKELEKSSRTNSRIQL